MGFGPAEVRALDRMNLLKREDGDPLNLMLIALGQSSEILAPKVTGPSHTWISATPLSSRDFLKRGKKKTPWNCLALKISANSPVRFIEEIRRAYPDLIELVKVEYLNEEHRCGAHGLRRSNSNVIVRSAETMVAAVQPAFFVLSFLSQCMARSVLVIPAILVWVRT